MLPPHNFVIEYYSGSEMQNFTMVLYSIGKSVVHGSFTQAAKLTKLSSHFLWGSHLQQLFQID